MIYPAAQNFAPSVTSIVFLAKLLLVLALGFGLLIGAVLLVPRPPSDFEVLLLPPDGCPMPCWIGIQPGKTRAADAMSLLQEQGWAGTLALRNYDAGRGDGLILWTWADDAEPAVVRSRTVRLWVRDQLVRSISLPVGVPFGDIWFTYGRPTRGEWAIVDLLYSSDYRFEQRVMYGEGVLVQSRIDCPASLGMYWHARASIQLGEPRTASLIEPTLLTVRGDEVNVDQLLRDQKRCPATGIVLFP